MTKELEARFKKVGSQKKVEDEAEQMLEDYLN